MKKLFSILLLLTLFCGISYKKTNKQIDKNKFFIKELNYQDFSLQKLSEVIIDNLLLVDSCDYICIRQKQFNLAEYYYYSIIDTINYYSYVYYYFNEAKQTAFVLVNYDKKGKYIDHICISSLSGDGGYFYNSEGVFVNDSVVIRVDEEGYDKSVENDIGTEFKINKIDENDSTVFTSRNKLKILLKKDGHILTDAIR